MAPSEPAGGNAEAHRDGGNDEVSVVAAVFCIAGPGVMLVATGATWWMEPTDLTEPSEFSSTCCWGCLKSNMLVNEPAVASKES